MNKFITLLALCASNIITFGQQAGSLDSSFANNGVFSQDMSNTEFAYRFQDAYKLFKLRDGSLLSIDFISPSGGVFNANITKLKKDGSLDLTFGDEGTTVVPGWLNMNISIKDIHELKDGSIILVANRYNKISLAKVAPKGQVSLWTGSVGVPSASLLNGYPLASCLTSDNKVLISTEDTLVLVDSSGKIDASFQCRLKNTIGISEIKTEHKFLLFNINDNKVTVSRVNLNGSSDSTYAVTSFDFPYQLFDISQYNLLNFMLYTPNFSTYRQINDSTHSFVVSRNSPNSPTAFTIHTNTNSISTFKKVGDVSFKYFIDSRNNVWVYNTSNNPNKWLKYNNNNSTPDTLNSLSYIICIDEDTTWMSSIKPFNSSSTFMTYSKMIGTEPDLSFGKQGSIDHRIFYDYDAPFQTVQLNGSFLVNSWNINSNYSSVYHIDANGGFKTVKVGEPSAKPSPVNPMGNLVQNGTDILLFKDSTIYRYDLERNIFKVFNPLNNNKIILGIHSSAIAYKESHVLIVSNQSITSYDYIKRSIDSTFGTNGAIPYPTNGAMTMPHITFTPTGSILVFNDKSEIFKYSSNGILDLGYGLGGKQSFPDYKFLYGTSDENFMYRILNDSIVTLKKLDAQGQELSLSAEIKLNISNIGIAQYDFTTERSLSRPIDFCQMIKLIDGSYVFIANKKNDQTRIMHLLQDFSQDQFFAKDGYLEVSGKTVQMSVNQGKLYLFAMKYLPLSFSDNTIYKINLGVDAVAVDDATYESTDLLYPNPTTGLLQINTSNMSEKQAEIFNNMGLKVSNKDIDNGGLDISELHKGIYLVKIGNQSFKVVKE